MGWRLIDTKITDPYYVTAVDEAISQIRKENKVLDTLHFYRRNPPAISIGRSRKVEDDINIDECIKNNVKIIRRTTGGGTIFTDEGCLIYSLIFNKDNFDLSSSFEIFDHVCNCIVNGFKNLDIITEYKIPNDILLNKKKISGSALIIKDKTTLIHGTIIYDTNLELMNKVLKRKTKTEVTTILRETNRKIRLNDIKKMLKKEFETAFNTVFEKAELSKFEIQLIQDLLKRRYYNDKWNYKR